VTAPAPDFSEFHAALGAWHRRGDYTTQDALWRAAAHAATGLEYARDNPGANVARWLEPVRALIAADPAARAAVERLRQAKPAQPASSDRASKPKPFAGSWERFG
jgi:hypothetical protein